ncbi:universal stress protein [Exilibacterium tricleocarpae]|nr:universal stress protein [Exilibacterium tricleocarpae]
MPQEPEALPISKYYITEEKSRIQARLEHHIRTLKPLPPWESSSGPLSQALAQNSCYHDLIILSRTVTQGNLLDDMFLAAANTAVNSACAVLMLPDDYTATEPCSHPLIAHDGSREAARALRDSLPFLQTAGQIDVFSGKTTTATAEFRQRADSGLLNYLRLHDVEPTLIREQRAGPDISEVLLTHAKERQNDLIVMGAYGRSRLAELVMGGATRNILKNAPVPVLLSH